jgi:N-acetylglucosamine-6-sulfatase
VEQIVTRLDEAGELENTYIFYTTDNGYHISQHRMHPGKECGYDTDIHIPFFVRGPNISAHSQIDSVTTHTDVSSTLLQIAGVTKQLDGIAMPMGHSTSITSKPRYEHIAIEYWGAGVPEGLYGTRTDLDREAGQFKHFYPNNTYKGLRLVSEDYSLYYSIWCTNETEYFDLNTDPFQTLNLFSSPAAAAEHSIASRPLEQVETRLNALIMVLKSCRDETCTSPWSVLHPEGGVETLRDALGREYDAFYAKQPKMWFRGCPKGFLADWESQESVSPLEDVVGSGLVAQGVLADHWQWFT